MIDYRTDKIVADLKRQGSVPTNQQLFTQDDFIATLNDIQKTQLVPAIMRTREEFFVSTYTVALIPDTSEYALPTRAIGHRVRKVMLVDSEGNERQLPRIDPSNKAWHDQNAWWPGTRTGYYFEGNKVVLTPNTNNSFSSLRLKYYRRPNVLVANDEGAAITAINTGTGEVTLDALPDSFTAGALVDIINNKPTFDSLADSEEILSTGASSIFVSLATAALLTVGQYVTLEGETLVPQYPEDLHTMLSNLALIQVLLALGDTQGAADLTSQTEAMEQSLLTLIDGRDDGSPKKIVSRRGLWDTGGI